MIRFHPHCVGLLMSDAQSVDEAFVTDEIAAIQRKTKRTDEEKAILAEAKNKSLSAGAKTFLKTLAKEFLLGYHKVVDTKYMEKGIALEDTAIQFLNNQRFTNYRKNTERRVSEFLTGECDIFVPGTKTIDIKVSWDLSTFPLLAEDAHDTMYEWQGRAYMKLWDVPEHEVVHVMLDTPDELIKWEQRELHEVARIDPAMRVTSVTYKRDAGLERRLDDKCRVAHAYLMQLVERMLIEHGRVYALEAA